MEAPPPTFIEDAPLTEKLDTMPFDHSWIAPDSVEKNFDSVLIMPIRYDLLPPGAWRDSKSIYLNSEEAYLKEAKVLAGHFRNQLLRELSKVPNPRFTVVEVPTPSTLIVSIALTQLEFSHPMTRAAALAAPLPGVDMALNAITDPHASFSARFTDPSTSQLLASAADKRFPPIRIIDLNKLTITSSLREIVHQWSRELSEAIQQDRFSKVEKSWRFSLLPW
jgi:hypothetical protein